MASGSAWFFIDPNNSGLKITYSLLFWIMRNFKTLFVLIIVWSSLLPALAEEKIFQAIMITDVTGLGDQSFNDAAWEGMQRAKSDLGIDVSFIQSYEQADYLPNLNLAAQEAEASVAMGFLLQEAVARIAPLYPRHDFIFIDGCVQGKNVASYEYKSQEGAYLAGIIAAAATRTGTVGVVEGKKIPPVLAFEAGFRAGITTAISVLGKQVQVLVVSAGDFNNPAKGKSLARTLIGQGADVLFQLAGNTGLGVLEAVAEAETEVYAIGSDQDQSDQAAGRVLTSVQKRIDVTTYQALHAAQKGRFQPGCHQVGLKSGGIQLAPPNWELIPAIQAWSPESPASKHSYRLEAQTLVSHAKNLIEQGRLNVPNHPDQLATFTPPKALLTP